MFCFANGQSGRISLLQATSFRVSEHRCKNHKKVCSRLYCSRFCATAELIPLICPNRWNNDGDITSFQELQPRSPQELLQVFEALPTLENVPVKIWLFIDGLNEYDGERFDIIHVVKTLVKSPYNKLYVSSRPRTVFVDAFQGSHWNLHLQDPTRNDIRSYIKDHLEENPRFQRLKQGEPIASEDLLQQIVSKAQVFSSGSTLLSARCCEG